MLFSSYCNPYPPTLTLHVFLLFLSSAAVKAKKETGTGAKRAKAGATGARKKKMAGALEERSDDSDSGSDLDDFIVEGTVWCDDGVGV